jgi:hypothetical protein
MLARIKLKTNGTDKFPFITSTAIIKILGSAIVKK